MTGLYHEANEPLLPDEEPDIRKAIVDAIGNDWLQTDNAYLDGRAPYRLIGTSEEYKLRNLVRTLTVAGLS